MSDCIKRARRQGGGCGEQGEGNREAEEEEEEEEQRRERIPDASTGVRSRIGVGVALVRHRLHNAPTYNFCYTQVQRVRGTRSATDRRGGGNPESRLYLCHFRGFLRVNPFTTTRHACLLRSLCSCTDRKELGQFAMQTQRAHVAHEIINSISMKNYF